MIRSEPFALLFFADLMTPSLEDMSDEKLAKRARAVKRQERNKIW